MNIHTPRTGDFIQTYTGYQFFPMDPRPGDIHLEDIAHALSFMCRYAGHCIQFYSVAEHSILVADWLLNRYGNHKLALYGLLHDAQEAYIVDVPRPLKPYLSNYREIEDSIWRVVAEHFHLDPELPGEVKEADNRILIDERNQNMMSPTYSGGWPEVEPLGVTLRFLSPSEAKWNFIKKANALAASIR